VQTFMKQELISLEFLNISEIRQLIISVGETPTDSIT
jgi:hypothetical protein